MTLERFREKTDGQLVSLAQGGDMAATEELLNRHSGLVKSCAHRYFLLGGETEDLFQEGMMGLYRAIGDYDEKRENSCSFKNFAYLCVSRKILDAVKKASKAYTVVLPIDIYMTEDGMGPEEILILNDEQREFRQKMSKELSDFEFKVTTMYMDGMTCADICAATGKPAKSVDNALQRSKIKLLRIISKK